MLAIPEIDGPEAPAVDTSAERLPPSLAVTPNILPREQTVEQLKAERDYWQAKIDKAEGWGAAVGAAASFRDTCIAELNRREALASQPAEPEGMVLETTAVQRAKLLGYSLPCLGIVIEFTRRRPGGHS